MLKNPRSNLPFAGLQSAGDLFNKSQTGEELYKQHEAAQDLSAPNTAADVQLSLAHKQGPMQTYSNPNWSMFYQALNEAAPGGIQSKGRRSDPMPGLPSSPMESPSTMWQSGQSSAVTGENAYTPNFSAADYANNQALAGLRKQADQYAQNKYPGTSTMPNAGVQ